MTLNVVL